MRKILLVEDNLVELELIKEELEAGDRYDVTFVSGIAYAEQLLNENRENCFDCVIIDLNMSNRYLDEIYKGITHGGTFTGWVWLFRIGKNLLANSPKIIIYSEFIDDLEDIIHESDDSDEIGYFNSATKITKSEAVDGAEYLRTRVDELFGKCQKEQLQHAY